MSKNLDFSFLYCIFVTEFYDFAVRNHSPRLVASCANLYFVKCG